jgi:hypothetical protein
MVHIESIENALSVGDFVVVLCDTIACSTPSSEGTPKKHKIGRIIDINDSGEKCHLNWWIRPSEEPILSPYVPTLSPTSSCQFIVACEVPEIVQTVNCEWVVASDVVDVAFVFHIDTVANLSFDCYGMRNGFVCRFRFQQEEGSDGGGVILETLSCEAHAPFGGKQVLKSNGDDRTAHEQTVCVSYSSRIWYGLQSIRRHMLDPILNRVAQLQSTSQSVSGYASIEAFVYLYRNVKKGRVHFMTVNRCQTLRWPDLSVSNQRKRWDVALLRIDTKEALEELKGTLGVRSGVGIRKRLFGRSERIMAQTGDVANFVTFVTPEDDSSLEDDNEEQHVSLRTRKQGIDFVYFLESSTLSLRVRFQRTSVNHEVIQNYLSEVSVGLRSNIDSPINISVGTPFLFEGKVLFVSQVDVSNDIIVGYEENSVGSTIGEPYLLTYAQALQGIREYSL